MEDFEKTTRYSGISLSMPTRAAAQVTVFDGDNLPISINLEEMGKGAVSFGRSDTNDIILSSKLVSREHGRFLYKNEQWIIEDKAVYSDSPSRNGLIYYDTSIDHFQDTIPGCFSTTN